MKPIMSAVLVALFLQLFSIATSNISFCNGSSFMGCIQSEREALLTFKDDLIDPTNRLGSWKGDGDCCAWAGVVCGNVTRHVLELNLRNPLVASDALHERSKLSGKINPSLLDLKHLVSLDLSNNNFKGIQIPGFLGSIEKLRYLNLSYNRFHGRVPHQLGNLSNLRYLVLGGNSDLYAEKIWWLSRLSLLKYLDLDYVNLSKVNDNWLKVTNTLRSLVVLRLQYCQLGHFAPITSANFSSLTELDLSFNQLNTLIPSWVFSLGNLVCLDLQFNNFQGSIPSGLQNLTSLEFLDLSYNFFNSSIPLWLYKFNHLKHLDLSMNMLQSTISTAIRNLTSINYLDLSLNKIEGKIPKSLGKLCNLHSILLATLGLSQEMSEILDILSTCVSERLESLYLSENQLWGQITDQLGQFKNLQVLRLDRNSISGPIPSSLGGLSSLVVLDISFNKLNGTLSQIHFTNLARLLWFTANENSLVLKVSPDWVPSFHLKVLALGSCRLGLQFPSWVYSHKSLRSLDLSNAGISDTMPEWFWKSVHQFSFLNLSNNQIRGEIPNLSEVTQLEDLDLSSNKFSGPLPLVSSNLIGLDLSNNSLSGSISHFLCSGKNESRATQILNLRYNHLYGELPDCWMNLQSLSVLALDNNNFSGVLPDSLGTLTSLKSLHLRKNSLSGAVPLSLKNCTDLMVLDFGENQLDGNLSTWIGNSFSKMVILNLHSNNFRGLFPTELCHLVFLQILDLAYNNLSGTIPSCISNIGALVTTNSSKIGNQIHHTVDHVTLFIIHTTETSKYYRAFPRSQFVEDTHVVVKGRMSEYNTILNLVRHIDLSHNHFSGKIPIQVTNLGALQTLNLSHNSFTGTIPKNIGHMRLIETLDLSANHLSGEIPESMSNLTYLSHLNLSKNNLIGKIPSSTQLQSLEASSFTGNELCGPPLQDCTMIVSNPEYENGNGTEHEVDWFYVSMALGFVVGFFSFINPLLINNRWRYIYCHFLDCLGEKTCSIFRKFF